MEHGLDTGTLAVVAGCFVLWALVSARLERLNVCAPIAFVVLGLAVAHEPLSLLDVHITSSTMRSVAEITLALVLFSDASRVNVRELRADVAVPVRLLGIGLPLSIAAGAACGRAVRRGRHLGRRGHRGDRCSHRRGARGVDHAGRARAGTRPACAECRERAERRHRHAVRQPVHRRCRCRRGRPRPRGRRSGGRSPHRCRRRPRHRTARRGVVARDTPMGLERTGVPRVWRCSASPSSPTRLRSKRAGTASSARSSADSRSAARHAASDDTS